MTDKSEQKAREPTTGHFGEELLSQEIVTFDKVHVNVTQTLIITTEDKLNLWLSGLQAVLDGRRQWIAPLGLVLSLTLALATTTFKDFGLSADTWKAVFIMSDIGSGVWLLCTLRHAFNKLDRSQAIAQLKALSSRNE